jgi:hypothetical protein
MKKSAADRKSAQAGMSLLEVILALAISAFTIVAVFQIFAFGAIELEKLGYRREALSLLKGEMEFWRARFQNASLNAPVNPGEADNRRRLVASANGMAFNVDPNIDPIARNRDLRYQQVRVRVSYERGGLGDTLELETKQYVW